MQIKMPIYWILPRKTKKDKKIPLGMNWYRNSPYFESNKVKKEYQDMVIEKIGNYKAEKQFWICYTFFYTRTNQDKSNFVALAEKFTLDALEKNGNIEGDTVKNHIESHSKVGEKDKEWYILIEII